MMMVYAEILKCFVDRLLKLRTEITKEYRFNF